MKNKKTLVYFSDCVFFAGCENMIPNFLNSKELNEIYNIHFIYRESDHYERELKKRLNSNKISCIPLKLPKQHVHRELLKRVKNISLIYKGLGAFVLFFWKYYAIIYSIFPLYKVFKRLDANIIHVNNGGYPAANTGYSAVFAARLYRVQKIIYVVNNIAQDYKSPLRWLDRIIDPYISSKVTTFITGSKNAGKALVRVLKLPKDKIVSFPNGVKIRDITLGRDDYLQGLNIDLKGRLLFSTIALLEKRKGHIWLLKAIKLMKESKSISGDLPFFIIEGEGSEKDLLEKYIDENDLNNDVELIGNTSHIFNLINASDVIVLPSIGNEDFPNVIIEAMSLGKPTIGTKIAGIPEQIDYDRNGYVVNPCDEKDLCEHMIKLMSKEKIKTFSEEASKKFDANYNVSVSVKNYINIYK